MRAHNIYPFLAALAVFSMTACGGGGDGPRVSASAQSLSLGPAPVLTLGATASVSATASSGLPVSYGSSTPAVCSVDSASGRVTALTAGSCSIVASQAGNASWAPAAQVTQTLVVLVDARQTLAFGAAPTLTLGGLATARASATSGLAPTYSSLSPGVCSVDAASGQVSAQSLGDCVVAADQAGNATYDAAARVTQTIAVAPAPLPSVPAAPTGVAARLGADVATVVVSIGAVDSGGSAVSGYSVSSVPAGITATAASAPVTVSCPSSCAGFAFAVAARNALGSGAASAAVDVITVFDVLTTFREPDTQPRDTVFTGSFTLNSTTGQISQLTGTLTESMTGNAVGSAPYYDMTQVRLANQLHSQRDAVLGGRFVATFARNTTATFSTSVAGGDGWSPRSGIASGGIYEGFPGAYASSTQNAYALIFVPDDPFTALTPAQLAMLAYADCAPGGMMGAACMTGTSIAGYGAVGTMGGFPFSQRITRR